MLACLQQLSPVPRGSGVGSWRGNWRGCAPTPTCKDSKDGCNGRGGALRGSDVFFKDFGFGFLGYLRLGQVGQVFCVFFGLCIFEVSHLSPPSCQIVSSLDREESQRLYPKKRSYPMDDREPCQGEESFSWEVCYLSGCLGSHGW